MELRTTREMRRNERLSKTAAKKTDAPAKAQPAQKQASGDKVTLSRQALAFLQEQSQTMWETAQQQGQRRQGGRLDGILDAMEAEERKIDAMSKRMDMLNKCQKIAAAIMRGDRVPPEDLAYLMEHDQEGYKMALAMRKPKEDPEDIKSVLDDEDKNPSAETGGGEAPEMSAPEAAGGGEASNSAE